MNPAAARSGRVGRNGRPVGGGFRWAWLPVAAALLAACSSAPIAVPREARPYRPAPGTAALGPAAASVVGSARAVLGAPYRYGGVDARGFDCSGLTAYAFAGAGVPLPRTAAAQAAAGRWVALDELRAGDLVFFAIVDKPNHVGVVVSAVDEPLRMIHASSSRGVVETEVLRDAYWLDRLRFGRRVLPDG